MSDDLELQTIEFESIRNKKVDDYFNARKILKRTMLHENLVKAGFRLAWEYLKEDK